MRAKIPFRSAEPGSDGSVLCPYCEIVYPEGADSERCELCGTPLVALRPPKHRTLEPPLSDFGRGLVLGAARTAESRWGAPLWACMIAISLVLLLQWGAATVASSVGVPELRATILGRVEPLGLALLAPLHLLGGLLVGVLLRQGRLVYATLAGLAVALPPLDAFGDNPAFLALRIGPVLCWTLGSYLGGRIANGECEERNVE